MAVKYAWRLLQEHGITGTPISKPVDALGWRETHKKIHVDMVGAFYRYLKKLFVNCDQDYQQAMASASNKLLRFIQAIVPKDRSILYLDGNPTLERDLAHQVRLTSHLNRQQSFEQKLLEFEAHPSYSHLAKLKRNAGELFSFTEDMKQILFQTAIQKGWTIFISRGEAEVEIGKLGGIVLTEDSDMLFYPNISTVIRLTGQRQFQVYYKSSVLAKLQLSSNAFTALGIIAPNDYESGYPECGKLISEQFNLYETISKIQQNNPNASVQDFIDVYTTVMNAVARINIPSDYYCRSYRVFVLQEEHLLPHSYDIRSGYLNTSAHYLRQIENLKIRPN